MDPMTAGVAGSALLFVLLILGMPVGLALALTGFMGISVLISPEVAMPALARSFYSTFTSYSLTVIPLFVLMGELASICGLSKDIYFAADKWARRLPGGLGLATIGACAGFSTICGSSVATAATLGKIALPEMKRYGYDEKLSSGTVAAGGALGFLIPPSVGFVIYGILTELSIGKLLIAGFLPGFMLAAAFAGIVWIWATVKPQAAPASFEKVPFKEKIAALTRAWELIAAFFLVMGGIYAGVFTPTEAGAAGAFFLFLTAIFRKKASPKDFLAAFQSTVKISVMTFIILGGADIFARFIALTLLPQKLAAVLAALEVSRYAVLAIILAGYLVLGCFLDAVSMMALTLPVIFPAILEMGFDPLWFGVISVLMMEAGLITPPPGPQYFRHRRGVRLSH
ncbi:C4-dicarboxylate ABC transporter permease [Candidatus Desulfarcum epimagneticum]|uniref:C4-dicarboxylate ABC transporter permease n=1 Tax=uncultured Desulfobacteraceae bacterium TaxID=218296 RepID=A0A484HIE1_9BACT|nr:C4-dicarboxylate ABC transporter permease [uncultured Desulfobacteraceae bacterium]